jgi:hypothetical protein
MEVLLPDFKKQINYHYSISLPEIFCSGGSFVLPVSRSIFKYSSRAFTYSILFSGTRSGEFILWDTRMLITNMNWIIQISVFLKNINNRPEPRIKNFQIGKNIELRIWKP